MHKHRPVTAVRLIVVVAFASALACGRSPPAGGVSGGGAASGRTETAAMASAPERPPPGCSIEVELAPDALGELAPAVRRLMTSRAGRSAGMPDLELVRGARRISYCQLPGAAAAAAAPRGRTAFVLSIAGAVRGDFLGALASAPGAAPIARETIAGVPVFGRGGTWMAQLGGGDDGEIVIASDRELLRAALAGQPGGHDLDPGVALSVLLTHDEIERATPPAAATAENRAALADVRELRFDLSSGARELTVRAALGGGRDTADGVKAALQPLVSALIAALAGSPPARIDAQIAGDEVVARAEVPPHSLDALATRIVAAAAKVHVTPRNAGVLESQRSHR